MNSAWSPLSAREGAASLELREHVPGSLAGPLRDWVYSAINRLPDRGERLMIRLDLIMPESLMASYTSAMTVYRVQVRRREELLAEQIKEIGQGTQAQPKTKSSASRATAPSTPMPLAPTHPRPQFIAYDTPNSLLLDIVDTVLDLLPYKPPPPPTSDPVVSLVRRARRTMESKDRQKLQQLLADGRMVYRIRADGRGLERQASPIATAAAVIASDLAEQAGYPAAAHRLMQGWNKIYSLKPDPGGAYHDAIRAVEAVAIPLFLPAAKRPTLGTVLAHLDQAGKSYELAIADETNQPAGVDAITEMIRTLWHGHRDRHEGGPTSGPVNQGSAQVAHSLAVNLVHLLSAGCVKPKPSHPPEIGS